MKAMVMDCGCHYCLNHIQEKVKKEDRTKKVADGNIIQIRVALML